jgi:hypothetical protein
VRTTDLERNRPRALAVGAFVAAVGAAMSFAPMARSQPAGYAMRFHGHGTGGIDRVEIPLDAPARPSSPSPLGTLGSSAWLPVALNGPGRPPSAAGPHPTRSASPTASPSPTGTTVPRATDTPDATRTSHPATPTGSPTATVSPTSAAAEQCRSVIPDGSFEACGPRCHRASLWRFGFRHGYSTGGGGIVDRDIALHEARSGRWMAEIRPGVVSSRTLEARGELASPTFEGEWPGFTRAVLSYAIDVHSQELLRADKLSTFIVHGDETHVVASYDQDALADGWTDETFDVTAAFRNSAATDPGGPSPRRPMTLVFSAVDDGGEFSEPTWWHVDAVALAVCTRR